MKLSSAAQVLLYLVSWLSLGVCLYNGNPGPYFFVTAIETHVSVHAPLGQFVPILDVTTNFFHVHAGFLSSCCFLLFLLE